MEILRQVMEVREDLSRVMRSERVNDLIAAFYEENQQRLQTKIDNNLLWNVTAISQHTLDEQRLYIEQLQKIVDERGE